MDAPLLPELPGYHDPQLIAHGATALVFRAIQTKLNRPVAIKVITGDTGSNLTNAARELATTVALSSQPHIVSIIDTGATGDDRPYIVMEYCEGGSYAQILRRTGPLPVDDVIEVGVKIGEALQAAHRAGIVHRDVKPSNVLRSRYGPALTDFGIARAPEELGSTLTREMMTPHHASPEALLHQAQSGSSDIYSLASTMWTLLVGHPPFADPARPAPDLHAFRDRVLHDAVPAMPRDDVPAWLVAELARAMAKLPAQRHGSAIEFAEVLRRGALGLPPRPAAVLGGDAPLVHPPGRPPDAWPGGARPPDAALPHPFPAPRPAAPGAPPVASPPSAPPAEPRMDPLAPKPAPSSPEPPSPSPSPEPLSPEPLPTDEALETAASPPVAPEPIAPDAGRADSDPGPLDDGGWLGPVGRVESYDVGLRATAPPDSITRTRTTRHVPAEFHQPGFDQPGFDRPGFDRPRFNRPRPGPRAVVVVPLVAVAILAAAGAAVLLLGPRQPSEQPVAGQGFSSGPPSPSSVSRMPAPSTTLFLSPAAEGAPRQVRLDDRGTTVVVTWLDPTPGTVPFVVTGRSIEGEPLGLRQVKRSRTRVSYRGLDPKSNYCFLVTAVYSSTHVAAAPWVCTVR